MGFRFMLLADDNFYPVTLEDLAQARRRGDPTRLRELEALRAERIELMERLALLPSDLCFYTQITMEAAEDPAFLQAMRTARIKGALVGIESVTPDGLKDVHKGSICTGRRSSRGCVSSVRMVCTCSGRSSSGCPATGRRRSWRPPRSPSAPRSLSRSS